MADKETDVYDSLLLDSSYSLVLDNSTVNTIAGADLTLVEPILAISRTNNITTGDTFGGQIIANVGTLTGDIYYNFGDVAYGESFYVTETADGQIHLIHEDGSNFPNISSLELVGEYSALFIKPNKVDTDDDVSVVCFARGTRISTANAEKPIERLAVGDLVSTLDHGPQPIRWIGATTVLATGNLAPIEIRAGTLGNRRDLRVSPQHRMLLRGWRLELLFAETKALAPAKALINDSTIRRVRGGTVEYIHLLFDRHEIVFAEGTPSESFHPGIVGLDGVSAAARAEIFALFPELRRNPQGYGRAARISLKGFEAKLLAWDAGFIPQGRGAAAALLRAA